MDNSSRYAKLTEFGKKLLGKPSLNDGLVLISKTAKDLLNADRCSIYIYDSEKNELWTTFADGISRIRISADEGLAGYTIKERKPIISNDPYKDSRFLKEIDHKTGYITKNIATSPVFSSDRKIIGVLQLLNKEGGFNKEDTRFMIFFSHYISTYLELASMFEDENEE
ncbi:GAF domain-containing protein [Sulfurimonas sp. HSL-1716]|uniref:GAF domain-containing protein n=1 Tax=Hydrocurvibacter sulfurireducens TaxID=3131937 RepID=UPI0031F7E9FC